MASATLAPYKNNSSAVTFTLQTTSSTGARYIVTGRALAQPYSIEITRRMTPSNSSGNDRIDVRVARVEANATTSKLATLSATLSISVPKDVSVLDSTAQQEIVSILTSLLNEETAMEATTVNIDLLLNGSDL